jgi:hypothetical protein
MSPAWATRFDRGIRSLVVSALWSSALSFSVSPQPVVAQPSESSRLTTDDVFASLLETSLRVNYRVK